MKQIVFFKQTTIEQRRRIYLEIEENCQPQAGFYIFLAIAALIVIIGLIVDSPAVVIGAMLIAPLFWPTISVSLAIARGDINLFKKSIWILVKATLITIAIVTIFTVIYPLDKTPGNEVLIRTNPNLLHLILAIASGVVGVFAILWPRIIYSLAGVLIAAALLPPLGVIGYGIANLNANIAGGALLLYFTNLIAIISIGAVLFLIYGIKPPRKKESLEFMKKDLYWTAVLLIIVVALLSYTMFQAIRLTKQENYIKKILIENIAGLQNSDIKDISITWQKNKANVDISLKLENNLTDSSAQKIRSEIENYLNKESEIKIDVIPVIYIGG